jgi:drug/metabolite transporter (DMT)-like permease
MKNEKLKGSIFVALGASSYGMLTTCVKLAYHDGFNTAEVVLSQYILGVTGLLILNLFRKKVGGKENLKTDRRSIFKLIIAGSSLGLTSVFYYLAVQYVSVSIGIILLMQTVWMGVILEMIIQKRTPGARKIIAVLAVLAGTVLATSLYQQSIRINWAGFGWGILAALSYTATMFSSNNIGLDFPPLKRSLYMILGGLIIVVLIFHTQINPDFPYRIFLRWGIILSIFGTILPPILLTRGMPLTGMGLGAIIASLEIPVSLLLAYILIREPISGAQWCGVVLIMAAVLLMNMGKVSSSKAEIA